MSDCDLCASASGSYNVSRPCCALRLLKAAPSGDGRKAVWWHLRRSVNEGTWIAILAAAEADGLIQRKAA